MKENQPARQTSLENPILAQLGLIVGLSVLTLALNHDQRKAIRNRDSVEGCPKCMFPHPHGDPCNGQQRLEVHHIEPQRFLRDKGVPEHIADHPHNLITICERAHHTHIHPDMLNAKAEYYRNKDSYKETFEKRDEIAQEGVIYWNPMYDNELKIIAKHQTRLAKMRGWLYPQKRKR